MSEPNRRIPMTFVELLVEQGIATLTLTRPHASNALNWAVFAQLSAALTQVSESSEVSAIVIAAAGNKFSSGADLGQFVRYLEARDLKRVVDTVRNCKQLFSQIAECPKPVVAAVQGAAVGGGVELALACHHIVATPRASFSFPETALGIVPFNGGTFRTPRRIGTALSKWLIYTGHALSPPKALQIGLIDQLVMPEKLASEAKAAARALCDDRTMPRRDSAPLSAELSTLQAVFDKSSASQLHAAQQFEDRTIANSLRAVTERPLSALEWAEKLIDTSLDGSLEAGAEAALEAVPALCARPEVLEAMTRAARKQ